jgi:hypothetical protein
LKKLVTLPLQTMRLILLLLTSTIYLPAFCQATFSFKPIEDDDLYLTTVKKAIKLKYLADSAAITGPNKKYEVALYRSRYDFLNEMFNDKEIIGNERINSYLTDVTQQIINSNPSLKNLGTRFLFSRAWWPNAFSTGEGTIVFNMGLLTKLNTESEMVFVLCHELAHLYLDHSNKSIQQYITTVYSDEMQRKLKDLKRQEFATNKELAKLEKAVAFNNRRHGRSHETEADSMAMVFIKNTNFDANGAITCLAMLDDADKDNYNTEKFLPQVFNFADYPFKQQWIKKEEAFFGVNNEQKITDKEADSLKTHPDCKQRIAKLQPTVAQIINSNPNKIEVDKILFDSLKKVFAFEAIAFCYQAKNISRCLYLALELQQLYPNNVYVHTAIGNCLNLIYQKQKEHTLNQVVSLPSPFQEKNYNTLLEFIQNLRLRDIAAISYSYLKLYNDTFNGNKPFAEAFEQSKKNLNNN